MKVNVRGKNKYVPSQDVKIRAEEKIQKLKTRKRDLVDSVISIDRNIGKSLTYKDLQEIFSID